MPSPPLLRATSACRRRLRRCFFLAGRKALGGVQRRLHGGQHPVGILGYVLGVAALFPALPDPHPWVAWGLEVVLGGDPAVPALSALRQTSVFPAVSDRDRNLLVYMYLPEGKGLAAGLGGLTGHRIGAVPSPSPHPGSQGKLWRDAAAAARRFPRGRPRQHLLEDAVPRGRRRPQQENQRLGEQAHHLVR